MVKTFKALGEEIPDPTESGPYWILKQGNPMLESVNLICVPVPRLEMFRDGRHVLHKNGHFLGLIVTYTKIFRAG